VAAKWAHGLFDNSPVTGASHLSRPLTSTRLPGGSLATSAARVVSVARINAMSLRCARQLHSRKAALGTKMMAASTSQGTMFLSPSSLTSKSQTYPVAKSPLTKN
jgi:hypothetical protein